jgi:hypothetical protein
VVEVNLHGDPGRLAVAGKWLDALTAHTQREHLAERVSAWTELLAQWNDAEERTRETLVVRVKEASLRPDSAVDALHEWAVVPYARSGKFPAGPEDLGARWRNEPGGKEVWLGPFRILTGSDLSEPAGVAGQERFLAIWSGLTDDEQVHQLRAIYVAAQPVRDEMVDILDDVAMRGSFRGTSCLWCPD